MIQNVYKKLMLYLLLFSLPVCLFAQAGARGSSAQHIVVFPLRGSNQAIIDEFGEELYYTISSAGNFIPLQADLSEVPADVIAGDFPPFLCPNPSMTRDAPFAITGELLFNPGSGNWHMRLYLWDMESTMLLCSDELAAANRRDCSENLPNLLEWLFSWMPQGRQRGRQGTQGRAGAGLFAAEPPKWLYAGIRGGGAVRVNAAPEWGDDYKEYLGAYYESFNGALSINAQLISTFGIQLEAMFNYEMEPFQTMSLMIPLMLRYSYRGGTSLASVFGGGYFSLPLSDDYTFNPSSPFGITGGASFGTKLKNGYLYLDTRYLRDLSNTMNEANREGYVRNMVTVSIGYEIGFVNKK